MATKVYSFRLDEELVSAVDKVCPKRGERSAFVSSAISEKLGLAADLEGTSAPLTPEQAMELSPLIEELPMKEADSDVLTYEPTSKLPPKAAGRAVEGLRPDAVVLLGAVRGKRRSSREWEKELGWMGLRYPNAEKELLLAGLVRFEGGVLVAEDEA